MAALVTLAGNQSRPWAAFFDFFHLPDGPKPLSWSPLAHTHMALEDMRAPVVLFT